LDLSAYTPGSVTHAVTGRAVATIYLGPSLPTASSNLPAGIGRAALPAARSCSGWGLPSRRGHPRRWWALTSPFHPYRHERWRWFVFCGTVPRVTPGGC